MKNKKLLFWIIATFMIIITLKSASAINLTSNIYQHFKCDNATTVGATAVDTIGNQNGTLISGVAMNSTVAVINQSYWFDGSNDHINSGVTPNQAQSNSVCAWTYLELNNNNEQVFRLATNYFYMGVATGNYECASYDTAWDKATGGGARLNQWVHLCCIHNTNTNQNFLYVNGALNATANNANNWGGTDVLQYGYHKTIPSNQWDGNMDELTIFTNRALNSTAVFQIYNATLNGRSYPWITPTPPAPAGINISINYNTPVSEEQLVFHYLLIKNGNITNQTTANLLYNGSVYNGVINWSNASYVRFDVNLTTPFVYNNRTNISFRWNYSLKFVNGSNFSNSTNYYNQNILWNLTKYPRINITAYTIGGAAINNFTLIGTERNLSTTTGEVYYWTNATKTLNISIDAPGYAITWALVNFTSGSFGAYNFSLYTTNSIMFYFRDEETNNLINNVSIELISDPFSNNYSTTNGTLYVDLLSPATYAMRYISDGYFERFYYFTLENRTFTNLTLYLLSNSTGSEVRATVYDENNFEVEDVYIKVLRYDITTNSYKLVEIARTNFEGQTNLHLVLNDEFYQFMIEFPFGTLNKITSPTYIYETTLTFQIVAQSEVGERFYKAQDLTYELSFNNATNNFRLSYTDSDNLISKVCLKILKVSATKRALYNQSCLTSPSGTILLGVTNTSGTTYNAQAYAYFSNPAYYLTGLTHTFETVAIAGLYGIFLIMILTIIFAVGIGWWSKSLALILTPLPLMLGSILNIIDISIGMCISIEIICVIVAYWISRRQ